MTLDSLEVSRGVSRYPVGISPIIDPDSGEVPIDSKGRRSYSTSMSYCPSIKKHVVMGYLPNEIAVPGKQLLPRDSNLIRKITHHDMLLN